MNDKRRISVDTVLRWAMRHAIDDREAFLQRSNDLDGVGVMFERESARRLIEMCTLRLWEKRPIAATGKPMRMICALADRQYSSMLKAKKYEHGTSKSGSLREHYEMLMHLRGLRWEQWGDKEEGK